MPGQADSDGLARGGAPEPMHWSESRRIPPHPSRRAPRTLWRRTQAARGADADAAQAHCEAGRRLDPDRQQVAAHVRACEERLVPADPAQVTSFYTKRIAWGIAEPRDPLALAGPGQHPSQDLAHTVTLP
jgi:hypothetical protein